MLGFITRGLVLVLGYAYPAYECYKTVDKNRVEIEELRFWCKYWIIVAILTVFERIGDLFLFWLPLYGEMKLALFIYLWCPKTKGTGYAYETFFRPCIAKHEPEIDRNLWELRARGWDLALEYWQKGSKMGKSTILQILQFLATQSGKVSRTSNKNSEPSHQDPVPRPSSSSHRRNKQSHDRGHLRLAWREKSATSLHNREYQTLSKLSPKFKQNP